MNQEKFIKLIRKIFLFACVAIIVAVFIIPVLLSVIFFSVMFFAEPEVFLKSYSPDQKYILSAYSTGGGIMYGSSDLQIYQSRKNHGKIKILATKIRNDGGNLSASNVTFNWINNNQVLLKLDGEEQKPVCYLVKVGEKPSSTEKDCPSSD